MILSIDLASRRYCDNGVALMHGDPAKASVEIISLKKPETFGLSGNPNAATFANAVAKFANEHKVSLILLDGPQAWKRTWPPSSDGGTRGNAHARECERATHTPGKTGEPGRDGARGVVKPASWTRMAEFSIAMFDALHERGWPRLRKSWSGEQAAIESFPTDAWRQLGHKPLPGKARARRDIDLDPWRELLRVYHGIELQKPPSHDELQAVVAGIAGLQMLAGGLPACTMHGIDPEQQDGVWREGYIVSPRRTSR